MNKFYLHHLTGPSALPGMRPAPLKSWQLGSECELQNEMFGDLEKLFYVRSSAQECGLVAKSPN